MSRLRDRVRTPLVACLMALSPASWAFGGQATPVTIYVDARLPAPSCTSYAPETRSCTGGHEAAFKTLAAGAARAEAGTTVLIRAGVYQEPLVPAASGTAERPIVFRNAERETVTIARIL